MGWIGCVIFIRAACGFLARLHEAKSLKTGLDGCYKAKNSQARYCAGQCKEASTELEFYWLCMALWLSAL